MNKLHLKFHFKQSYHVCLCVGEYMLPAASPVGLHKLVQSLCGLQGERSQLRGELRSLHFQLEQREQDRHTKVQAFQQQVLSIIHMLIQPSTFIHAITYALIFSAFNITSLQIPLSLPQQ